MIYRKIKRRYLEDKIHISVVSYLRAVLTPDVMFLHVPNGGQRNKRDAAKLKAMGLKAGAPDLLFFYRQSYQVSGVTSYALQCGAIELKSPTGYLRPEQKEWKADFERIGGKYKLCRSIEDVRATLYLWGIQTRES